ncbi:hypothetical protein AGLY_008445 [Aphis glycines]|uniref:Uncharacterized protein n=1 Tax=Aphis glycines TaxID=307491 RepID=A0A6G0TK22_APHGL|nr:hypothetical protein AGLY_008445 [Aphis glycines]
MSLYPNKSNPMARFGNKNAFAVIINFLRHRIDQIRPEVGLFVDNLVMLTNGYNKKSTNKSSLPINTKLRIGLFHIPNGVMNILILQRCLNFQTIMTCFKQILVKGKYSVNHSPIMINYCSIIFLYKNLWTVLINMNEICLRGSLFVHSDEYMVNVINVIELLQETQKSFYMCEINTLFIQVDRVVSPPHSIYIIQYRITVLLQYKMSVIGDRAVLRGGEQGPGPGPRAFCLNFGPRVRKKNCKIDVKQFSYKYQT